MDLFVKDKINKDKTSNGNEIKIKSITSDFTELDTFKLKVKNKLNKHNSK